MVKKLGIIGFSEGNGHPFSFSAIVNGYDKEKFKKCGWPVILSYLERKDKSEFGVEGIKISAVWTQCEKLSKSIAEAMFIDKVCSSPDEMLDEVDGVIIARDDWESHYPIAMSFLRSGLSVFIDKPLSLDIEELHEFEPYLINGQLMSCAALRYAVELDDIRSVCKTSMPTIVSGMVISDWNRYGVHLLDGIFSAINFNAESVYAVGNEPRSVIISCSDGKVISLICLGECEKTFNFVFCFQGYKAVVEVEDNFIAFRRTLQRFRDQIYTEKPAIDPRLTMNIMRVLIAANISVNEKRVVYLNEII